MAKRYSGKVNPPEDQEDDEKKPATANPSKLKEGVGGRMPQNEPYKL